MQLLILIHFFCGAELIHTENLSLSNYSWFIDCNSISNQDITVDALRIEQIGENEGKSMAAGAAMAVVGWWSGYKLGGVLVFIFC